MIGFVERGSRYPWLHRRLPGRTGTARRGCRDGQPGNERDKGSAPLDQDLSEGSGEPRLLCRFCRHPISSETQRVVVGGSASHTMFNPAGIVYQLGCFRNAPGCLVRGEATDQFSWFAGYRWSLALCGLCQVHLGWYFQAEADSFFGLIEPNLIQG